MSWQLKLKFLPPTHDDRLPDPVITRVLLTDLSGDKTFSSTDIPVTQLELTVPVGPDTPVLPGPCVLRLHSLSVDGRMSEESGMRCDIEPPIPAPPQLAEMPVIQFAPPEPPPSPPPSGGP